MTMKKQDRKAAYVKTINHLISGEHKEAFDSLADLMAGDVGLCILASYEQAKKSKVNNANNQ